MITEIKQDENGTTITAKILSEKFAFTAIFYSGLLKLYPVYLCDVKISVNRRLVAWYSEFFGKPTCSISTGEGFKKFTQKKRANNALSCFGLTIEEIQKIHKDLNQELKTTWENITTHKN